MRVVEIRVTGLFDRFNHELVFPKDERITIMIAPNGYGKTMILQMVNALFNQRLHTLARMPFRELRVQLDDGMRASVWCLGLKICRSNVCLRQLVRILSRSPVVPGQLE